MEIHVYHGPNLASLSRRDTDKYGNLSLEKIVERLETLAGELSIDLTSRQTNHEGELLDWINQPDKDGLVLNPAGFTHTSVAIRDAVDLVSYPVVEVHLSNVEAREDFRRESLIAPVCIGQISGFKITSYELGLRAVVDHLQ